MRKFFVFATSVLLLLAVFGALYWATTFKTYEDRHPVQCQSGYVAVWISSDHVCLQGYKP